MSTHIAIAKVLRLNLVEHNFGFFPYLWCMSKKIQCKLKLEVPVNELDQAYKPPLQTSYRWQQFHTLFQEARESPEALHSLQICL